MGGAIRAAPLCGLGTRDERHEAQPLWSVQWQVMEKMMSLVLENDCNPVGEWQPLCTSQARRKTGIEHSMHAWR